MPTAVLPVPLFTYQKYSINVHYINLSMYAIFKISYMVGSVPLNYKRADVQGVTPCTHVIMLYSSSIGLNVDKNTSMSSCVR